MTGIRRVGSVTLVPETPYRWRIDRHGDMRVPGIIFSSDELLPSALEDRSFEQVINVATLPGIVGASYAMPDMHWGYGFPIGGVAATEVDAGGVVSPGGVGFDISCGVRVLTSTLTHADFTARADDLMAALDVGIPRGLGKGGVWTVGDKLLDEILVRGARVAVEHGFGTQRDIEHCEDFGQLEGADPNEVSHEALRRGIGQVGSLGSGNHFLEVQVVDQILDTELAGAFGMRPNQICVMIHSGSRGLGHQICTDHVRLMQKAMQKYGISVPDRQLACAPARSEEGMNYMAAMAAAANYGRTNRQLLMFAAREAFAKTFGAQIAEELLLLYDISHNLAKFETHTVDGKQKGLCVHRKGATRALPPGHNDLPQMLRDTGQPVLVPGSMGTASYVLAGATTGDAFNSCCHGAGRTMSRHAAKKKVRGRELIAELEKAGVIVRAQAIHALGEEAPIAYKDIDAVVEVCIQAGLARPVARLRPVGSIKA